jgi:hypothetical protein
MDPLKDLIEYDPKSLFSTGVANAVMSEFAQQMLLRLAMGEPLNKVELKRLGWYPRIAATACNGRDHARIQYLIQHVLTDPRSQFLALAENYEVLSEHLEPLILKSPEFTYRLLDFYRRNKIRPAIQGEIYYQSLRKDPNYYAMFLGANDPEFLSMVENADSNRYDSAAAAYFYIENSPEPLIDDDIVRVLCTSEEYSLRVGAMFGAAQNSDLYGHMMMLLGQLKSPRFMFTGLSNGNLSAWHEMWLHRLLEHGPWFVEFVESVSMPTEKFISLYHSARHHFATHECRNELLGWAQYRAATLTTPMTRTRRVS